MDSEHVNDRVHARTAETDVGSLGRALLEVNCTSLLVDGRASEATDESASFPETEESVPTTVWACVLAAECSCGWWHTARRE